MLKTSNLAATVTTNMEQALAELIKELTVHESAEMCTVTLLFNLSI